MAVTPSLRFAVLERDGFKCQFCGKDAPEAHLEIDHIVPQAAGGDDSFDNLVTACVDCNRGKGARIMRKHTTNNDIRENLEHLKERRNLLVACGKEQGSILQLREGEMWKLLKRWLKARNEWPTDESKVAASWDIASAIRSLLVQHGFTETLNAMDITLARHHDTSNETHAIKYLYAVARNRAGFESDTP